MTNPTHIAVRGERPYDVVIGARVLSKLPELLGHGVRRVAVIHAPIVRAAVEQIGTDLRMHGYEVHDVVVPDGEDAKTAEVAARCWSVLGRAGFTRSDAVVGLGGGATTDVAGFVAATWLRGVRVVHIPTTVAGMTDAAIGGKTAINTPEGKNLVGAFHPPTGVLCDLRTLANQEVTRG